MLCTNFIMLNNSWINIMLRTINFEINFLVNKGIVKIIAINIIVTFKTNNVLFSKELIEIFFWI